MFGKSFESKYTGSMVGAGAMRFAVWDFVITTQKPSRAHGSVVEINPILLAVILGEQVEAVEEAINFLCSPDPKSRSKERGGRRLLPLGEYIYQVVNGAKYRAIRDEDTRRTQSREAQRRFQAKRLIYIQGRGGAAPGEAAALRLEAAGDFDGAAAVAANSYEKNTPQRNHPRKSSATGRSRSGNAAGHHDDAGTVWDSVDTLPQEEELNRPSAEPARLPDEPREIGPEPPEPQTVAETPLPAALPENDASGCPRTNGSEAPRVATADVLRPAEALPMSAAETHGRAPSRPSLARH